jgi:hypothetical protein
MDQHLPLQYPPKFTQIGIFGLKIYLPSGNPAQTPKNKLLLAIKLKYMKFNFLCVQIFDLFLFLKQQPLFIFRWKFV